MKKQLLSLALAAASVAVPAISSAAPATYETSVLGNSPYVYYRFNDAGGDETTGADSSGNGRNGTYNGDNALTPPTPIGGEPGVGTGSDNAVRFALGTGATRNYLRSPISGFGSLIDGNGTTSTGSSYEFIYKVNSGFATNAMQSLFGAFSTSGVGTASDVEITLNSRANDSGGLLARSTRIYFRGSDGDQAGAAFVSPATGSSIYDGNYHHVVFTYDNAQTGVAAFKIYVDGVAQTLTDFSNLTPTATDADNDPDAFINFNGPNATTPLSPVFAGRNVRNTAVDGLGVDRLANVTIDEAALYGTVLTAEQVAANATAAGFVVPEPATLAALALGGFALTGRRRRKA